MPVKTKDQLKAELNTTFFQNSGGGITPALVQTFMTDTIDSVPDASSAADPLNLAQYNGVDDCTAALQAVLDSCFGPAVAPHSASNAANNKEFILPPGTFNITSPLIVTNVRGGALRGAGRFTTNVVNTAGGDIFHTDGFEYSRVSGMHLHSPGTTATLFNLDWTNGGGTALQSNTFSDMYFSGGSVGVGIGYSGFMGSENLFLNCFFSGNADAGIFTSNFNALQNTVIGGNCQGCGVGIWVNSGSVPNIFGVGFQLNTNWDIRVDNSAGDTYCINGCRSESVNFASLTNGAVAVFEGCTQRNVNAGNFIVGSGPKVLIACQSQNGIVSNNQYNSITVERCLFGRSDWQQGNCNYIIDSIADVQSVGSNFTLNQRFISNSLLVGNGSSAPWTLTIPLDATMYAGFGFFIPTGVRIDVVQNDAHQITIAGESGVAVHTARSLTTRAQYSVATLTKVGANEWVVSGDLT